MAEIQQQQIVNFETLISFDDLIEYCILINAVTPEIAYQEINLSPNETVTITLSFPADSYSIEKELFIGSEDPYKVNYTIYIDTNDTPAILTGIILPTVGNNTEKIVFYKNRIKKKYIKLVFRNTDTYRSIKVWFKSWIQYITKDFYDLAIKPIIKGIENQIYNRGNYLQH